VWLTGVALGSGAVTLGVWLTLVASLPFAIERTVTVMVIACPHALGLAVPLVVAVSTGAGGEERPPDPRPFRLRTGPRTRGDRLR